MQRKIVKKNEARRRMLQKETRGNCEKYKELRKDAKTVCKKKKKKHLQKKLVEIQKLNRQWLPMAQNRGHTPWKRKEY
jgi:hypothetical protein